MAEGVVCVLLKKLCELIEKEAHLLAGVKPNGKLLREKLEWISLSLEEADNKCPEDKEIKLWVAQVRAAAFEAEDIIDTYLLEVKKNRIKRAFSIRPIDKIGKKIQEINSSLDKISENRSKLGIGNIQDKGEPSVPLIRKEKRSPRVEEANIVGIEDEVEIISKMMLIGGGARTSVVSIVGMGGLARRLVITHHDIRKHISVSCLNEHLRSLFFSAQPQEKFKKAMFKSLSSGRFKFLRVMQIANVHISMLPDGIGRLIFLSTNLGDADDGEGEGATIVGAHLDEEDGDIAECGEDVLVGVEWDLESRDPNRDDDELSQNSGGVDDFARAKINPFSRVVFLHKLGKQIKKINSRLDNISENRSKLGFGNVQEKGEPSVPVRKEKKSPTVEEVDVVGVEDEAKVVSEMLIEGDARRSVVSIVGMGGLDLHLFNKELTTYKFRLQPLLLFNPCELIQKFRRLFQQHTRFDFVRLQLHQSGFIMHLLFLGRFFNTSRSFTFYASN
ncbi:hypothetical protein MRB53_022940 [Persea americana]|uniref:Uncharacterized protein n=1 Tax=Persea americana TaxID=3435 RepID=A0ACC2L8D6_PERAE|nr:hypothetical protein MRB53_022940 [Persea americana]